MASIGDIKKARTYDIDPPGLEFPSSGGVTLVINYPYPDDVGIYIRGFFSPEFTKFIRSPVFPLREPIPQNLLDANAGSLLQFQYSITSTDSYFLSGLTYMQT
ncbi:MULTISPECIES: hypothetical protein [Pseudomonas]|uniref:hypothetical protein n=1 Tax=Pseudomonas TaxID=286 RepID=UPI000C076624|nr:MULTISPECIES: hypothetical protein [Pseudomonas]MCD5977420.1 hypothetical protein [Pseudomonas quasicaspiana]PHN31586.1 hypothetical protein AO242_15035 [Pseudomonas sp. ICMP 561]